MIGSALAALFAALVVFEANAQNLSLDADSEGMVLKWANEVFRISPDELNALRQEKQEALDRITELEVRVGVLSGQLAAQSVTISRQNYLLNRLYDLGIVNPDDVPGGFTPTVIVTP